MNTFVTHHLIGAQMRPQAGWFRMVAGSLVFAFFLFAVTPAGWSQDTVSVSNERTEGNGTQFGLGAASFFLTIPYGLAKVVYATFGGIIGGFTYALTAGNEKAANSVWSTSLRGTYVITPEHLRGEKAVRFFGVPAEPEPSTQEPSFEPAPAPESPASEPMK